MRRMQVYRNKLQACLTSEGFTLFDLGLAKWLDNKLKPLSLNQYTITDIFDFVKELPQHNTW